MEHQQQRQFATFKVGNLFFGINVHEVQEIIRYQNLTPVPLADSVVRGLINLRGQIITAIDLRRRLKSEDAVADEDSMNIVVQTDQEKVSLLVDSVGDVLELSPDSFESVPPSVRADVRALVSGVYKLSGKLMLVLDTKSAVNL